MDLVLSVAEVGEKKNFDVRLCAVLSIYDRNSN